MKEVSHGSKTFCGVTGRPQVYWHDESSASDNYETLGRALVMSGDLFRQPGHDGGLFLVKPDGTPRSITKGKGSMRSSYIMSVFKSFPKTVISRRNWIETVSVRR